MKLVILYILCFLQNSVPISAQLIKKQHVPRQPYNKYIISEKGDIDSVTFYLTEFSEQSYLPLIIYIQGSGNSSLFESDNTGKVFPKAGHISWAYNGKDKAKVLVIEKPGVEYLKQGIVNEKFDTLYSLDSWVKRIEKVIRYIITSEKIDTSKILIAGHSEGGLVAASVAKKMGGLISHTTILAGEGPSQLYSLYKFAEIGEFFNSENSTIEKRIDSVTKIWLNIISDPLSVKKKFWGFTYLRWSSFLNTSVIEQLAEYKGRVLIIQGDADKNVFPESAQILYNSLLARQKQVTLEVIKGADHSFNLLSNKEINGWEMVVKKTIKWFLNQYD